MRDRERPYGENYHWTGNPEIKAALTELFAKQAAPNKSLQWRYRRMPDLRP
jgi:hypothetical protein